MKTKFTMLILMLFASITYAQQDAQYTQYMYNTMVVNPAYAGSRGTTSIFGLYRTQWVGIEGAPTSNTFAIHSPINETNVGLGLSIINDKLGPSDESIITADFSYSLPIYNNYKLSFGLNASADLLNIDYNKLVTRYPGDPVNQTNVDNKFLPNMGIGVYLHSQKSYFGLSTPRLLITQHFDGTADKNATSFIVKQLIHYYFIAGHVFDLNENIKLKSCVLAKMVQGAPLQVDVSGNFLINEKFTAGLAYRRNAAMSVLAGFQINDSWFIGYTYDMETTKLANYNSGSHEIFLRYEFFKKIDRIISPRFF